MKLVNVFLLKNQSFTLNWILIYILTERRQFFLKRTFVLFNRSILSKFTRALQLVDMLSDFFIKYILYRGKKKKVSCKWLAIKIICNFQQDSYKFLHFFIHFFVYYN